MKRACGVAAIAMAAFLTAFPARLHAQNAVKIKGGDIGGAVTGPHGPEAGVWVIAETHDFFTRYAKIVVTDDQGRYVVPDLPKAKYQIWVRGYGLVDSPKVDAEPGKHVNLTAVPAPNEAAAAKYYPAIYWFAMLKIPGQDQSGGKSDIPANITQTDWLTTIKNQACVGCHQLGQLSTRTIPAALGEFKNGDANERQLAMYDPKTKKFTFIDTCFGTHHLQFGFDKDNTLWTSGAGVAGWLDTKVFEDTGNAEKAQGWAPFVLDTNGNGKRDDFTKPGQPEDPTKDMELGGSGTYAVMPNPVDGSIWYTWDVFAGKSGIIRFDPKTKLSEVYYVPKPGFGPRGGDKGRGLGIARQRPPRQFRSLEVQGTA